MKKILFLYLTFSLIFFVNTQDSAAEDEQLDSEELDKLLSCSYFVQQILIKEKDNCNKTALRINSTFQMVQEKIGSEIYEQCMAKITKNITEKYFRNVTLQEPLQWDKENEKIINLNFQQFNDTKDLEPSAIQKILLRRYHQARKIYERRAIDQEKERQDNQRESIKIGNFDLGNMNKFTKFIIFVVVFACIFGALVYMLSGVVKHENKKKKKKKSQ